METYRQLLYNSLKRRQISDALEKKVATENKHTNNWFKQFQQIFVLQCFNTVGWLGFVACKNVPEIVSPSGTFNLTYSFPAQCQQTTL